jgi:hypothetical protein
VSTPIISLEPRVEEKMIARIRRTALILSLKRNQSIAVSGKIVVEHYARAAPGAWKLRLWCTERGKLGMTHSFQS